MVEYQNEIVIKYINFGKTELNEAILAKVGIRTGRSPLVLRRSSRIM